MRGAVPLLGIGLLLAVEFALVRATNFGGYDDWFLIDLVDKWIIAIPYTNRPLHYLWALPARVLMPHQLTGFLLVHVFWLLSTAWLVFALTRRVLPRERPLAFLAGAFAAVWTASDPLRLSCTVGLVGYAGPTAALLASIVCFVEAFRRSSLPFLALAMVIASITARAFEGVVPLLAFAPVLLHWSRPPRVPRLWLLLWETMVALLVLLAVLPLLLGNRAESYQMAGLGLDLAPWRVAWRLLRQFGFQILPLVTSPPREIASAAANAALAVAVFAATFLYLGRSDSADRALGDQAALLRIALLGLVMAALGYSVFVLSPSIMYPQRTQFLSAPGIALFLAALVRLVAGVFPVRLRRPVALVLGCWVVAVGVGRTAALQREIDETTAWPAQNDSLVQLTDQAPGLQPHTLVVLIDEAHVWPAGFSFRHAVSYLYAGRALAVVVGAHQALYPWSFVPQGALITPWRSLQQLWSSPPTLHRYEEMVVFRLHEDGRLQLEEAWPKELPPLPAGASYAPQRRIVYGAAPPPSRAILRRR
jgi:hypothetical protein